MRSGDRHNVRQGDGMRVVVESLYSGRTWDFEGTARQIEASILMQFPWLRTDDPRHRGDLEGLIEHLNCQQAYSAEVVPA